MKDKEKKNGIGLSLSGVYHFYPAYHYILHILSLFVVASPLAAKQLEVQIETPHAILMDAKTGKVLYEKKGREKVYPASTTKIATALYILKTRPEVMDEVITCSEEALRIVTEATKRANWGILPDYILETDGTMIHLRRKEKMLGRDLLHGAILRSGNDAANVLAEYVSGDIKAFVSGMNQMVKELGCATTNFRNPHGLLHAEHVTTAYEMALLMREALKYPLFREIIKKPAYERPKTNLQNANTLPQNNALVKPDHKLYYPYALGGKTGYQRDAKYNMAAVASNGTREVIAVLHKSPSSKQRYQDAIALFDAAFAESQVKRLLFVQEETSFQKEIPKGAKPLLAALKQDLYLTYYPSEEEKIKAKLEWKPLSLPIAQGAPVADLIIVSEVDGRVLLKEELIAKEEVVKRWMYQDHTILWVTLAIMGGVSLLFGVVRKVRGDRKDQAAPGASQ